jgi:hypothetical protein
VNAEKQKDPLVKSTRPVIVLLGLPPRKDFRPLKLAIAKLVMDMAVEPKYSGVNIYMPPDLVENVIESNITIEMSWVDDNYVPVIREIVDLVKGYFQPPICVQGMITFTNGSSVVIS